MPRQQLELSLEGKIVQAVFRGTNPVGLRGVLKAWDPDQRLIIIQEIADNNVPTPKHCVIPMENLLWFSFEGELTFGSPA